MRIPDEIFVAYTTQCRDVAMVKKIKVRLNLLQLSWRSFVDDYNIIINISLVVNGTLAVYNLNMTRFWYTHTHRNPDQIVTMNLSLNIFWTPSEFFSCVCHCTYYYVRRTRSDPKWNIIHIIIVIILHLFYLSYTCRCVIKSTLYIYLCIASKRNHIGTNSQKNFIFRWLHLT